MKFLASVNVMPLKELLDPQGKAVKNNIGNIGVDGIADVRIGKHIQITIEAGNEAEAKDKAQKACENLLHNPVMEYFEFTISAL